MMKTGVNIILLSIYLAVTGCPSDNNPAPTSVQVGEQTISEKCNDNTFQSSWFCFDAEAQDVIMGKSAITLPLNANDTGSDFGLRWRVILALRQLGYEPSGINTGEVIGASRLRAIDAELATVEQTMKVQANKLPNYYAISGPDFLDNLPQSYAAYLFATIFDLMNAGPTVYQAHTNECILANLVPMMCGALVDMGTSSGQCKYDNAVFLDNLTVQTPELFGFINRRDEITDSEHPGTIGSPSEELVSSTFGYVGTLIHEMVHDLDDLDENWPPMHAIYDRRTVCSSTLISYSETGTPFNSDLVDSGNQDINDFVSLYASGLSYAVDLYPPPDQAYLFWEDFAESVVAYILAPEYFRDRMQYSSILEAKYQWIRDKVFGGVEFTNPDLIDTNYLMPSNMGEFANQNQITRFRISNITTLP